MSQEEQIVIVGRVTVEYAETRRKLAALFSEVDRHADALQAMLWYLKPRDYSSTDLRSAGKPPDFSTLPTAEALRSLVGETLSAMARKKELHGQLKEFGAEPKD